MRAVIQRVSRAQVSVNGEVCGRIGHGLLVLLGVGDSDTDSDTAYLVEKIAGLRIFEDDGGKMNLSVADVKGAVLVVSQFTLYGDVRAANGPLSMRRHALSGLASCMRISSVAFAPPACHAKPDASTK